MPDVRQGQDGHFSFAVLEPRYGDQGEYLDERDNGGRDCHSATIVAVNPDGTVNLGGWNHRGEPRQWIDVLVGKEPLIREADPAGGVFHAIEDCPYGR